MVSLLKGSILSLLMNNENKLKKSMGFGIDKN